MKLSTKTRYGLRGILELGLNYGKGPLLLKDIAKNQGISLKYLDHIFSILKTKGFIKSIGKGKGYILLRHPSQIKVWEIISALEEGFFLDCLEEPKICVRSSSCGTRRFWMRVVDIFKKELSDLSLQDLIDEQKNVFQESNRIMYYI